MHPQKLDKLLGVHIIFHYSFLLYNIGICVKLCF